MTRLIQRALSGLVGIGLSAATASAIGPHERWAEVLPTCTPSPTIRME